MDDSLSADDQKGDYSCLEILEPLKIMPHNWNWCVSYILTCFRVVGVCSSEQATCPYERNCGFHCSSGGKYSVLKCLGMLAIAY
jgi:hypothetical protein